MAIRTHDDRNQFKKCIGNTINTSDIPENKNPTIQIVVDNTKKIQNNFEKGRTLISYQGDYRKYHKNNELIRSIPPNGHFLIYYIDTENKVGGIPFIPDPNRNIVTFTDRDINGQLINIRVNQYIIVSLPDFRRSTSNDIGEYWIATDIEPNLSLFISSSILNNIGFPVTPNTGLPIKFNFNNNKFFLEFLGFNLYINVNEDFNSNILYFIINHPYRIYFDKDLKQTQKIPLTEHTF